MRLAGRPLAVCCVSYVIFAAAGYFFSDKILYIAAAAGGFSLLSLLLFALFRNRTASRVLLLCFFSLLFSVAALYQTYSYYVKGQEKIVGYYNKDTTVTATCIGVSYKSVYGGFYDIRTSSIGDEKISADLRLATDMTSLSVGDVFSMSVTMLPFEENENGYAQRIFSMGEGFRARCEQTDGEFILLDREDGAYVFFYNVRHSVGERFDRLLGERGAAIYSAVFAADGSLISEQDMLSVRRSGTSHLLAVSGMHFTVIMGMMLALFASMGIPIKLRYSLLGAVAFFYAAFTGFSAPVVRSALMLALTYLGTVIGRNRDGVSSLSLAVMLMLAFRPNYLLNVSFWLSSSATLGIILVSSAVSEMLGRRHRYVLTDILRDDNYTVPYRVVRFVAVSLAELLKSIPYSFAASIALSIAAIAFSLPFSLLFFGSISLVSIPSSLLLSPVVSAALTTAPAVLLLGGIAPVADAASLLGDIFFSVTRYFSDIDGVYVNIDYPATWAVTALLILSLAVFTLSSVKTKRLMVPLVCLALVCVPLSAYVSEAYEFSQERAVYGEHNGAGSLSLRTESGLVIADMGGGTRSDIRAAAESCSRLKENEISAYIFTDVRSNINSLVGFLSSNYSVGTVYLPDFASKNSAVACTAAANVAREHGVKVAYFRYGEEFFCGGYRFLISELEFLSRSDVPIYSVCAERGGESVLWLSGSFFDGKKSSGVYAREYGTVIFGTHGPRIKGPCRADLAALGAHAYILPFGQTEQFTDGQKKLIDEIGRLAGEDGAWLFPLSG